MWPYGYGNRAINDMFERALTLQRSVGKGLYCSLETTLPRMRFAWADNEHVSHIFEIVFHTMLALELLRSDFTNLSRSRKYTIASQMRIYDVLKSNAVIRRWMEPHPGFFDDLVESKAIRATKVARLAGQHFAQHMFADPTISWDSAEQLFLRQMAVKRHSSFVDIAIDAVMQQLWNKANSTWLQNKKQANADAASQCDKTREHCSRHLLFWTGEHRIDNKLWLPKYEDGMSGTAEGLVAIGKDYASVVHERWIEPKEANRGKKGET